MREVEDSYQLKVKKKKTKQITTTTSFPLTHRKLPETMCACAHMHVLGMEEFANQPFPKHFDCSYCRYFSKRLKHSDFGFFLPFVTFF